MNSHTAMRICFDRKTLEFAKRLNKSLSTICKWQEPTLHPDDSGLASPLDRLEQIVEIALSLGTPDDKAIAPVEYLAQRFGYILMPVVSTQSNFSDLTDGLLATIEEFGNMTASCAEALKDRRVSPDEAEKLDILGMQVVRQILLLLNKAKQQAQK